MERFLPKPNLFLGLLTYNYALYAPKTAKKVPYATVLFILPLCFAMHIQYFHLIPITNVLQTLYIIFKPTISLNCKIKTAKFPNKLKTHEKLTRNLNKIFWIYLNFKRMESVLNNDAIQGNILLNRITKRDIYRELGC